MQQPAKPVTPSHIERFTDRWGLDRRATVRRDQTETPVRATAVVVTDEDLNRVFKMLRVQDQEPVQTFGPNRPHEPFRNPIRLRCVNRRPHDRTCCASNTASKLRVNLQSRS